MSTTLANARIQLSKEIGDYWASTTTSSGSTTTVVDTALKAKTNDWISDAPQEMYDLITSGTYDQEERKISSLDITTGTLTTLAHGGTIGSGITYEVHRMFSASDKRVALVQACKTAFPAIYRKIISTSKTMRNWLRDPDFEDDWTSSAANTYWIAATSTQAKNTTAPYFTRGVTSLKLTTAAGSSYQSNTQNTDLNQLAGQDVTFKAWIWSDTASDTRLQIYDGTTTTYSDYHTGGSAFEELSVTATIKSSPSVIRFSLVRGGAASTVYMDDARVFGPHFGKVYIGDLNLANNLPHSVEYSSVSMQNYEVWQPVYRWEVDTDGYLLLPDTVQDYMLRIKGVGYLDFLTSGASSTAWTATVDIDSPQLLILTAEAIIFLFTQLVLPNYTSGDRDAFAKILQYWQAELKDRINKFGMVPPPARSDWGL